MMQCHEYARILIADRDPAVTRSMQLILKLLRCKQWQSVHHRRDAETSMEQILPDLVILDQHLPGGGMSWLHAIRQFIPDPMALPVILMTDQFNARTLHQAFDAGVYHCLTRPPIPLQLGQIVCNALQTTALANQRRIVQRHEPMPAKPQPLVLA